MFVKKMALPPQLNKPWFYTLFQAPDESALHKLTAKLTENNVDHKLWIEQPEDYPTCLAVRPYRKGQKSEMQTSDSEPSRSEYFFLF